MGLLLYLTKEGLPKIHEQASGMSPKATWASLQLWGKPLEINLSRNPASWKVLLSHLHEENPTQVSRLLQALTWSRWPCTLWSKLVCIFFFFNLAYECFYCPRVRILSFQISLTILRFLLVTLTSDSIHKK